MRGAEGYFPASVSGAGPSDIVADGLRAQASSLNIGVLVTSHAHPYLSLSFPCCIVIAFVRSSSVEFQHLLGQYACVSCSLPRRWDLTIRLHEDVGKCDMKRGIPLFNIFGHAWRGLMSGMPPRVRLDCIFVPCSGGKGIYRHARHPSHVRGGSDSRHTLSPLVSLFYFLVFAIRHGRYSHLAAPSLHGQCTGCTWSWSRRYHPVR